MPGGGASRTTRSPTTPPPSGWCARSPARSGPTSTRTRANPWAHEHTTGPEIWRQTAGRITHFVAGVGTGGTITGVARYLKAQNPDVQIVGADPAGSVYSGRLGPALPRRGRRRGLLARRPTTRSSSTESSRSPTRTRFLTARRVTRRGGPPHRRLVRHRGGRGPRGRPRAAGPTTSSSCSLPDSGRGYLSQGLQRRVDGRLRLPPHGRAHGRRRARGARRRRPAARLRPPRRHACATPCGRCASTASRSCRWPRARCRSPPPR